MQKTCTSTNDWVSLLICVCTHMDVSLTVCVFNFPDLSNRVKKIKKSVEVDNSEMSFPRGINVNKAVGSFLRHMGMSGMRHNNLPHYMPLHTIVHLNFLGNTVLMTNIIDHLKLVSSQRTTQHRHNTNTTQTQHQHNTNTTKTQLP